MRLKFLVLFYLWFFYCFTTFFCRPLHSFVLSSEYSFLHFLYFKCYAVLQRVWTGLCRRADILKQGDIPPRRGKHWKSHDDDEDHTQSRKGKEVLYKQVTEFVTPGTDLSAIVKQQFDADECDRLAIVGLHTCGDLASSCLRIFCSSPQFFSLCNVGCCYHLMEEKHCRNPFWNDVDPLPDGQNYGFPMSQFLNDKQFSLGRNARMLAAQSLERMGEQQEVSFY